jgi:DNA-binding transcriptional MerR regulator
MASGDPSQWLSAADCASRTGLTVRALRVYEDCGLISPRRNAGGWRLYGPHDLIKLNTVVLLKTAGLSLEQIREVTCGGDSEPSLQQILGAQLRTWKRKRADAERGQGIVEAALDRVREGRSLSVDELCDLIRSFEMTQSPPSAASPSHDFAWTAVEPSVLDSYAGFYQGREYAAMKVWRDGRRLLTDAPMPGSSGTVELHALSQTEFYPTNGAGFFQFTFLADAVRIRVGRVESTLQRIDVATAEALKAKLVERIQSQKALPGSEASLRRFLEGIETGNPPYEEMTSQLAQLVRSQLALLQPLAEYLGAIRSMEFRGVGRIGADQYDVHRERGTSRWQIHLTADGKIGLANLEWDRPA